MRWIKCRVRVFVKVRGFSLLYFALLCCSQSRWVGMMEDLNLDLNLNNSIAFTFTLSHEYNLCCCQYNRTPEQFMTLNSVQFTVCMLMIVVIHKCNHDYITQHKLRNEMMRNCRWWDWQTVNYSWYINKPF